MNRKVCECCFKKRLGYCPFDYACKYDVWERFGQIKKQVPLSVYFGCNPGRSEDV